MSQTAPSDTDPSADTTLPSGQSPNPEPGSCQDVPAALTPPPASLQPPLTPESFSLPQSTEKTTTEDTAEGPTDQPEGAAQGQLIECDQPVSLEPDTEAAEENVEVCGGIFLCHF